MKLVFDVATHHIFIIRRDPHVGDKFRVILCNTIVESARDAPVSKHPNGRETLLYTFCS